MNLQIEVDEVSLASKLAAMSPELLLEFLCGIAVKRHGLHGHGALTRAVGEWLCADINPLRPESERPANHPGELIAYVKPGPWKGASKTK